MTGCSAGGGVAAVIYNNAAGVLSGTFGGVETTIPSVGVSDIDGAALKSQLGTTATVALKATNYAYFNGTSMAAPHVSAVAALVWSYHPTCSAANLRKALTATAEDLGATGRDVDYGFGLVRALNAKQYLDRYGCAGS